MSAQQKQTDMLSCTNSKHDLFMAFDADISALYGKKIPQVIMADLWKIADNQPKEAIPDVFQALKRQHTTGCRTWKRWKSCFPTPVRGIGNAPGTGRKHKFIPSKAVWMRQVSPISRKHCGSWVRLLRTKMCWKRCGRATGKRKARNYWKRGKN